MSGAPRLVGDGIENPRNARALLDAAAMFGLDCAFRDTHGLADAWSSELGGGPLPSLGALVRPEDLAPIVAIENGTGSKTVYEYRAPTAASIVLGNERRGIRGDLLRAATDRVEIPMAGRGVNTLNVASAGAIALYYLLAEARQSRRPVSGHVSRRPDLLLSAPTDHVEAGSVIRSAAAFGWRALAIDDRNHVWFGVPRAQRTEGRAAARSHRNDTRVLPMRADSAMGFARVIVAGAHVDGPPLHRVSLAGGANSLLVLPDEEGVEVRAWSELGPRVEFARVSLPRSDFPYRYRLVASIVLAEAARQLGPTRGRPPIERPRRDLGYRSVFQTLASAEADVVSPAELRDY